MLKHLALVAVGGGIGSALRFLVSVWAARLSSEGAGAGGGVVGGAVAPASPGIAPVVVFPWGTLIVNLAGCLAIGLIAALTAQRSAEGVTLAPFAGMDRDARLFLVTGLLGGFTTFSAFGIETLSLLRDGAAGRAVAYLLASVLLGLALAWAGWALGLRFAPAPAL